MAVSTRKPLFDVLSNPLQTPPDRHQDNSPFVGLLATLLAIALVVALLTLAASLMSIGVPGETVWFDWVLV